MRTLKWKLNRRIFVTHFIGNSKERILCKLSKSEILRLYTIVHVAMETTKTSRFTCQSKSFISIFFTCQVSACELQPFSCQDLANDIYSITDKTVFSHLKRHNTITMKCHWIACFQDFFGNSPVMPISIYKITEIVLAFWLVKNLWFIIPVNS